MLDSYLDRRTSLFVSMLAPAGVVLLLGGCFGGVQRPSAPPVYAVLDERSQFAGNTACAECHRAEFDLHKASRHAITMRVADRQSLGNLTPPLGPIPNSDYALREHEGSLRFERIDRPEVGSRLRFALGSGKDAMTYVGEFGKEILTEYRMTFMPGTRSWCLTPGQHGQSNLALGVTHQMGMARRCILCHATKIVPGASEPDTRFLGVGCESCHGPGAQHIASAKAGRTADMKMEDLSKWNAARLNAMCARCHRSIDDVPLIGHEVSATARFQGYGLELSPCFRKSGNHLSCITCHDPHADGRMDRSKYEKACLACHSPTASGQKSCPVNPRNGCVPCHMPKREVFGDRRLPLSMADHLIMAYRTKRLVH